MKPETKPKSKMVSFRLPEKHIRMLNDQATAAGVSKSAILRQAIEQSANNQNIPQ